MFSSAILILIVLFALPAVLDHGGSFREVDDERERQARVPRHDRPPGP